MEKRKRHSAKLQFRDFACDLQAAEDARQEKQGFQGEDAPD